jgi:phospholipid/cholesterol/gamma-HCH transport system permease protein
MRSIPIENLGFWGLQLVEDLGRISRFGFRVVSAVFSRPFRFRRLSGDVFDAGVLSLPVVCLSGFVIGGTLSMLGHYILSKFGADEALGALVGLSVIRELGPVLTALLVTGRAGSAIAAEIATMITTEQLDGLRMMSVDPIDYVVSPKALALMLVMPLLTGIFIVFAIGGGYAIAVGMRELDGGTFTSSLEGAVAFSSDIVGCMAKAVIFGALAGLIATYRGYTSEPTAAGVSAATTSTVVTASVAILVADFFQNSLWGI